MALFAPVTVARNSQAAAAAFGSLVLSRSSRVLQNLQDPDLFGSESGPFGHKTDRQQLFRKGRDETRSRGYEPRALAFSRKGAISYTLDDRIEVPHGDCRTGDVSKPSGDRRATCTVASR